MAVSLPNVNDFDILWSPMTHSEVEMIGRKDELKRLKAAYDSPESEFVSIYGRRRIGKTYLVNEAFDTRLHFTS